MKRKDIENKINFVISNSVPDVLDDVLIKCKKKKEVTIIKKENVKRKNNWLLPLTGGLATAAFVFGIGIYNNKYKVDSIVNFDVNPSVELKVNKKEDVIDVVALNEDAKIILEDMDFKNVDLDVAVNAIIGSMVKNGYINNLENSILISVKNNDSNKSLEIQNKVSNSINELLESSSINASILTQEYQENSELKEFADKYDISLGKAKLIKEIISTNLVNAKGEKYTEDELAKLSINEINMLMEEKETIIEEVKTNGKEVNKESYIGKQEAKNIALKNAGTTESKAKELKVEFDVENGVTIYEVEFTLGNTEYDYEINAKTGDIIKKEKEIDDDKYDDDDKYEDDDKYDDDDDEDDD